MTTDKGLRTNDAIAWLFAAVALQFAAHSPFVSAGFLAVGVCASAILGRSLPKMAFWPAAIGGAALAGWQIAEPLPAASPRRALLVLALACLTTVVAALPARKRPQPNVSGAARWIGRGALLLLSVALSIGGAEQISIWFLTRDLYVIEPRSESPESSLYIQSDDLKWRYTPGFIGEFTHPEYAAERFEINADGYRDGPWPDAIENDGESIRALFLGDSFGVGFGVEETESYPSVVEQRIGESQPDSHLRAYNASVAGYGPAEQVLVLPALLQRVRPHYVVAAFYDGNDLDDIRVQLERARLPFALPSQLAAREGQPTSRDLHLGASLDPNPSLLSWRYWKQQTTVGRLVNDRGRVALAKIGIGAPDAIFSTRQLRAARLNAEDIEIDEELEVAGLCYRAMRDACQASGATLLLVRIPGRTQSSAREWEALLGELGLDPDEFDRASPGKKVLDAAEEIGALGVDLLETLDPGDEPTTRFYYAEGHLNRSGHSIAAQAIASVITKHLEDNP